MVMSRGMTSQKSRAFSESVIREMTRLCLAEHGSECVNLAQGFPDFAAPSELKEAAIDAIRQDFNQYATTWGAKVMRDAIADKTRHFRGMAVDPETEITVCCGVTEAMLSTILAVVDPGDEVIIFEPFYENYGPDCILSGATPVVIPLVPPDWRFDPEQLRQAFSAKTRAIIINTPHNPTGKVYTREELGFIGSLCQEFDTLAITDEIYEHLVYRGEHLSIATLDGMRERTVTINGLSKTYSVTGWRLAYTIAPADITNAIRKVHDFVTVGAPHPLQVAAATALRFPDRYYIDLLNAYRERREFMLEILDGAGFKAYPPDGAYYVMTEIDSFGEDDVALAHRMVKDIGLATVPGSSFYLDPARGRQQIRFSFPKKMDTLRRAADRLKTLQRVA
ncbi:MAG: aminotransferase class I/II-fold pyridoxal phosphate-dependent enzyme [Chloroflexi bacterium]|nr:MAG: aminotransferase class I/II-fold pyridoxal phosphate-dependent enzyme [Chloroflexota bacterium]TME46735.1 MAG: aminotransferase class I/II-fold pyridoxal phosphate-dependent enzyme [Chloroflexota bacterium]